MSSSRNGQITVESIIDNIVKDITSTDIINVHSWPMFLLKVMQLVEKYRVEGSKLVGGDKEAIAIGVLDYMVDRAPLDEVEKGALKTTISYSAPTIVRGFIAVSKGEFDLNVCSGWCRKFCFWL